MFSMGRGCENSESAHISWRNYITLIPILIEYTLDAADYPVKKDESTVAMASN